MKISASVEKVADAGNHFKVAAEMIEFSVIKTPELDIRPGDSIKYSLDTWSNAVSTSVELIRDQKPYARATLRAVKMTGAIVRPIPDRPA